MMQYKPTSAVWEVTMGCNMRCKHCGSSCEQPLQDELTTEEALRLCDDLGELGLQVVTLSGGEPTTRKDWHLIAKRLRQNGVIPTMITNGWILNEEILEQAKEANLGTLAISIDGLEETHDYIRKKGSFQRIMQAFEMMKEKDIVSSAITTIQKRNIDQLPQLKELLIEKGVKGWQLQIGIPMGNLSDNKDLVLDPIAMEQIVDFAHDAIQERKIDIHLADCIGYYHAKEIETRKISLGVEEYMWNGCGAGKSGLGILHNGDIVGCTSIRNKEFIEGNIKQTPLKEIWNSPHRFGWSRNLKKQDLKGLCAKCQYGTYCLGGCPNTRLTMNGDIYSENRYCLYHISVDRSQQEVNKIESPKELYTKAGILAQKGYFQVSEMLLSKALQIESDNPDFLSLFGYVNFMLENYQTAKEVNEQILNRYPEDVYANKGMGLSLAKLGELEKGIQFLHKAISLTDESFMDPYYDLAVTLLEHKKAEEALGVLEEGRRRSEDFIEKSALLYERCKEDIA